MKKILITTLVLIFSYLVFAEQISTLVTEFNLRDQKKLTVEQSNLLSFLKKIKYETQEIIALEELDTESYVFENRNGDVCIAFGFDFVVNCKNKIGISTFSFRDDKDLSQLLEDTFSGPYQKLTQEYIRRYQLPHSDTEKLAFEYLKSKAYNFSNIVEFQMLDDKQFVFRDKNGDICLGEYVSQILRCKNEMGITGITYDGDAD